MPCPDKPAEGWHRGSVVDAGTITVGLVGLIVTIIGMIANVKDTLMGVFIAARAAGFFVPGFIGVTLYQKCWKTIEGPRRCMAGIVDRMSAPATSNPLPGPAEDLLGDARDWAEDNANIFPFLRDHPNFTMVVKCLYWPALVEGGAGYVWHNRDVAGESNPLVTCYLKDPALCSKLTSMMVWSALGAAGGTYLGLGAEAAALAACGASVFCAILAFVVFLAVAIGCALVGAKLGDLFGGPGQVVSGEPTGDPETWSLRMVRVGDYLAVCGTLVTANWLHDARAYWFVEKACWYGHEEPRLASWAFGGFSHTQADEFLTEDDGMTPKEEEFCSGCEESR